MYTVRKYSELLIEIDLNKLRIKDYETRVEMINKLMIKPPSELKSIDYSGMPKGSTNYTTLDRYADSRKSLLDMLDFEYTMESQLEDTRVKMVNNLKKMKSIKYKIAYDKLILNLSYREIAERLNVTEQYVKNTWSKINKEVCK